MLDNNLKNTYKFAEAFCRVVDVASYDLKLTADQHRHLRDGLSTGQIKSKIRALEIIGPYRFSRAVFIGHWHGMLPRLFYDFGIIQEGIGIELDPFWCDFSRLVNYDWFFLSFVGDANLTLNEYCGDINLIVNTSCEHMYWDWLDSVPKNSALLLQGTNMPASDHINPIHSLDDLQSIAHRLNRDIIKSDVLALHDNWSRFTVLLDSQKA